MRRLVVCSHTYFNDMCVEIFLSFNELWFAVNRIPQQLPDGRREKLELPIHIMNFPRQSCVKTDMKKRRGGV